MALRRIGAGILAFVVALTAIAVNASETITYSYDAHGRVVGVSHSGTVNNGQAAAISYDPADNRSNYTITGGSTAPVVSIGNASVTEGGNLVFTVTRTGTTTGSSTVTWSTANGTATAGSDYTAGSGTVTFAAGETSKTITVATIDDTIVELAETMTVTLASPSGATIGTATGTGTINDNDIGLAIGNASTTEGGNLVFTVARSGDATVPVSVNWATAGGTATSGSDFTAGASTLNFAANQTSATITVATIDDTVVESTETMSVTLSGATGGATITTATGTGTINDNDVAAANLAIGNASTTEGGNLVFTVTRSGNTASAVTVNYATAGGTATSGSDFTAKSGTLSFAANQTTATITVATIDDTLVESTETMSVTLSGASSGATITTATGTGTINDNDSTPANLAIGNASTTEGGNLVFTVTRSGNTANAVTVNWATAGGTAASGSDFTAGSGTLSFAANQTSATITVTTINDTTAESTETMSVTLSGASSGAAITTATGTGTILDNDTAWTTSLTSGTYNSGYDTFWITFYGYDQGLVIGSLASTAWKGLTITSVTGSAGSYGGPTITFSASGATAPANSGWTSITIPGVGTYQRSAATYSTSGTVATWQWPPNNSSVWQVTSGTLTIQ
jgi:YD repeat-containing protein